MIDYRIVIIIGLTEGLIMLCLAWAGIDTQSMPVGASVLDTLLLMFFVGIINNYFLVKPVQKEIRQSKGETQIYKDAMDQSHDGMLICDTKGVISYANDSMEDICSIGDRGSMNLIELIHVYKINKDWIPSMQDVIDFAMSGSTKEIRLHEREKDVMVSGACIFNKNGEIQSIMFIVRDITLDLALREQAMNAEKDKSISVLASGVAHDFNNMMAAVSGHLYLINKANMNGNVNRISESIQTIQKSIDLSSGVVKRLLTYARESHTNMEKLGFNNEFNEAMKILHGSIPGHIALTVNQPRNECFICADGIQMNQVIFNLVLNAVHATKELDAPAITIDIYREDGFLNFIVNDNGEGFSADAIDNMFTPFFTTKLDGTGNGLGLSVVQSIVEEHHGIVQCYNIKGAVVKVQIPLFATECLTKIA